MGFFGFLTSRGFAAALLFLSVCILVIWNKFPAFYSPFFLVIPAFVFLSISLCVARRAATAKKDAIFLGSVVFHAGLLLVIAAVAAGTIIGFRAIVSAPHGLTVDTENERFVSVHHGAVPYMSFRLERLDIRYEQGIFPVEYSADVLINFMDKGSYVELRDTLKINFPIRFGQYQFLYHEGVFSPRFLLKDGKGVVFDGYINVSNRMTAEDSYKAKDAGLTIYTRFFPDVFKEGGKYGTRTKEVRNPAFGIRVVSDKEPFKDVWKGVLKLGEKAEFQGYAIEFKELRPMLEIQITNDPAYRGIYAGWLLIVAGLVIRYVPLLMGKRLPPFTKGG